MPKVYSIEWWWCEDSETVAVFSSRGKAEAWLETYHDREWIQRYGTIVERELDPPAAPVDPASTD